MTEKEGTPIMAIEATIVSERANMMSILSTSENVQKATGILKWSWSLLKAAGCTVRECSVDL